MGMLRRWLHKHLWRKRPFRKHHWGEWGEPRTIRICHPVTHELRRTFTTKKRGCSCGAWQSEKLYDSGLIGDKK